MLNLKIFGGQGGGKDLVLVQVENMELVALPEDMECRLTFSRGKLRVVIGIQEILEIRTAALGLPPVEKE